MALIERAIAAATKSGEVTRPEPLPPDLLARLVLPNGEPVTPSLRAVLAFDAAYLGLAIDEETAELVPMDLEELIEEELGDEMLDDFAEAFEILSDDCFLIEGGSDSRRFLYVGNKDSRGEYPVITIDTDDGPWVGGFVPFDVWIAQRFGALPEEKHYGWVPDEYRAATVEQARLNGDGRVAFVPEVGSGGAGSVEEGEDDDED